MAEESMPASGLSMHAAKKKGVGPKLGTDACDMHSRQKFLVTLCYLVTNIS
jgi:hypothetical protein